ncbi:MAG: hypothetical protein KAU07_01340 [Candidatus Andersenbacteria bacterium]|nr:hypothetical protein [Candidatus Andersenbacteria bacterium]
MSTHIVCAEGKKTIFLEDSKVPHVIIVFKGTNIEEIERNRPSIEGVNLNLVKFLGDHRDVQRWDFILWNGKIALLIPKRYVILSREKILSICLLFKEED